MASGIVRRTMVYLGLTDDDEFDYDAYEEPQAPAAAAPQPARRMYAEPAEPPTPAGAVSVRPIARDPAPSRESGIGREPALSRESARTRESTLSRESGMGRESVLSRESGASRESAMESGGGVAVSSRPGVVRPMPAPPPAPPSPPARVHVVSPSRFSDAQEIGDRFKNGQPVLVDLRHGDRELSRRMIDFCSGITYGLGGGMEKVADQVFLLTPSSVEISAEERRRLAEKGLYRT